MRTANAIDGLCSFCHRLEQPEQRAGVEPVALYRAAHNQRAVTGSTYLKDGIHGIHRHQYLARGDSLARVRVPLQELCSRERVAGIWKAYFEGFHRWKEYRKSTAFSTPETASTKKRGVSR